MPNVRLKVKTAIFEAGLSVAPGSGDVDVYRKERVCVMFYLQSVVEEGDDEQDEQRPARRQHQHHRRAQQREALTDRIIATTAFHTYDQSKKS